MTTKELQKKYKHWLAEEGKYKLEFFKAKQEYKATSGFKERRKAKAAANEVRTKLRNAIKQKAYWKKQLKWQLQSEGKDTKI